jgi:hypothetical protein
VDYWEKYFLDMSGEQVKECLKIIFHFNINFEVLRSDDMAVRMVINTIVDNLKRDAQKRIKQSKASRENGKKGGRGNKAVANASKSKQKVANLADNENKNKSESRVIVKIESELESQFEEFWNLYNKKIGRAETEKKFVLALKKVSFEKLTEGLKNYISKRGNDSQFWKNPATWLHQQCWQDEYSTETNRDICKEINQIIGEDWIIKIEAVEERAILSITQTNWQKMKGLSDEIKKKIAQKLNQELKTTEIKQKYID